MPPANRNTNVPEVSNCYPDTETYAALVAAKDALVALAASVAAFGLNIWSRTVGGLVTLVNATDKVGIGEQTPTSSLQVAGTFAQNLSLVDADVEITGSQAVVNCAAGNRVPTLPQAALCPNRIVRVRCTNTGGVRTCTITPFAGDTIGGAPNFLLSADGDFVELHSTGGSEWMVWTAKQAGVPV